MNSLIYSSVLAIFFSFFSCTQEDVTPLPSPNSLDLVSYLPSKVVFTDNGSTVAMYQITYDNNSLVKEIKEQVISSDSGLNNDSSVSYFMYQNHQVIAYTWQSTSKKKISYGFEYDDNGLLINLLKNNKSVCQQIGASSLVVSQVVLKSDLIFDQDTIRIMEEGNRYKVYSNRFYLYSYQNNPQQLTLFHGDIEQNKTQFSNQKNEWLFPFKLLLYLITR